MKEWGAEHVSILPHKREEGSSNRRDGDVEEDSLRPPCVSPLRVELVLPADTKDLEVQRA